MFVAQNLHLILYTLFCILQFEPSYLFSSNLLVVNSLHVRKNSQNNLFHVIEYHPEDWYYEDNEDDNDKSSSSSHSQEEEKKEVSNNKPVYNFTMIRDLYRAEIYSKTIYSGLKDNRAKSKKEILLGFSHNLMNLKNSSLNTSTTTITNNGEKKIICYYNVPTMNDLPYAVFPEQIIPDLCTHIIIGFARVFNFSLVPNDERDVEFYNRVNKLKLKNPNLKVMIGVGSTNDGSQSGTEFVNMMKTQETRGRFINQSIQFLSENKFDGVEIDWEFPTMDGPREQKDQLTALLNEFKASSSRSNNMNNFLLSVAVPAIKLVIDLGYDIPAIAKVVDFIDLMCYDYHHYSLMTPLTGPNSPLYNDTSEMGFFATLNMAWSTKYWYENGMPADKIIVGMPTYGHSYELADERYHNYYSVAKGFGKMGSNGFVSYVPICNFLKNGTSLVMGPNSMEPYAYKGREWISFDNEQSAKEKATFVKSMNFGGMMFYSLNSDDAWKLCKTSKTIFPIVQSAKNELLR